MKFPMKKEIRGQSKCELLWMEQASTFLRLRKKGEREKTKRERERERVVHGAVGVNDHNPNRILKIHGPEKFKMAR